MQLFAHHSIDSDHHKMNSLLEKLPIDMIKSFLIFDSLHLLDLDIIKYLLTMDTCTEP